MRAGPSPLPLSLRGAKPPTGPVVSRKSPMARRVLTRGEIYSQFYKPPARKSVGPPGLPNGTLSSEVVEYSDGVENDSLFPEIDAAQRSLRSLPDPADAQTPVKDRKPKTVAAASEGTMVMIIDSRRLMQLYFAKKFLQLDMLADVHATRQSAAKALAMNPSMYRCDTVVARYIISYVLCIYTMSYSGNHTHFKSCLRVLRRSGWLRRSA